MTDVIKWNDEAAELKHLGLAFQLAVAKENRMVECKPR
jgi:hypothetical protein